MTTEKELRETLVTYGCGLEIQEFTKYDRVHAYPTRLGGIHKISLNLRGHLSTCPMADILKHLLSNKDFDDYQSKLASLLTQDARKDRNE